MTLATRALGATAGMMNGPFKQGATQDAAEGGELTQQFVALGDGPLTCHHSRRYILASIVSRTFLENMFAKEEMDESGRENRQLRFSGRWHRRSPDVSRFCSP